MKASETKFQPIIEGTKQYVVPLFQRPYSWEKKEWDVLWDDLVDLCENPEPRSHFIGSIVTMPAVSVPEGVSKYLLIDGQQRLTTIFILLTLLRDLAKQSGDQMLADEINQTMLVNPFKKGLDYYKLMPTQADRNSFQMLVQAETPNDSQFTRCYQFFGRKLAQGQVDIRSLSRVITNQLSVVSIVLDPDDNPHLVFESLNAKGKPLTQADLIRNYFFMRIHVEEQEGVHERYWSPMQSQLGDNLTEFIRHFLMQNGSFVKQGEVYFTLKDRIAHGDALAALKDIAVFANYYKKLLDPESELNVDVRTALVRLNRLEVTTAYPFLLSCYHDYAEGKLSRADFLRILRTIENFILRRFVCNVPTSQLNKIFPLLYSQANDTKPASLPDGVCAVLQNRSYPKDAEFRTRLIETKLYGAGERAVKTKLILETIESSYNHKEQVPFVDLTIEHIMPQTLTPWWENHLGDDWQVDHELYLHTLGNLTLTGYNSELSNLSFAEKKHELLKSHLELNKYFQGLAQWKRSDMDDRSKRLAEIALSAWPYFGDSQLSPTSPEGVTGRSPKLLTILGQRMTVDSWRDVQFQTLNTIAELEPDLFTELAERYPRFISQDASRFRRNRQLNNAYFIEMNLSAREVYRFCSQAIESIGLSDSDWRVDTN